MPQDRAVKTNKRIYPPQEQSFSFVSSRYRDARIQMEAKLKKNRAVEVDIKRSIAINKADMSDIKSEEFKGKVMNKKDKLKALRRRRK